MGDVEEAKTSESKVDGITTSPKQTKTETELPSISLPFSQSFTPGKFGTYCSFVLLIIGMIASIIALTYSSDLNQSTLTDNCPTGYEDSCREIGAVLRFSFALVAIFILQLIGTTLYTRYYDILWIIKYLAFAGTVVGFFYTPERVFDANGYAWFARIGGFLFLIFQQIILLDFACKINDKWVSYAASDEDNRNFYLGVLLAMSLFIYMGSFSTIGVMYWQFGGPDCSDNLAVISLTLILSILVTIFQIAFNAEYSLLSSAIMTGYATYICYASVTLNPRGSCNPTLNSGYQTVQAAVGIAITTLSLVWSTYTAVLKINEVLPDVETKSQDVRGYSSPELRVVLQETTVIFILISCYYAMVLTNWSTLQSSTNISNPKTGSSSFWLEASAQWISLSLYAWSLMAPKLFPDRDFS